jgi:hypothetical protein
MVGLRPIIRNLLHYGSACRICPDCHRPEDLKITCRHCASEYPRQTALDEVVQQILRLAVGIPVAVTLLGIGLLVASLIFQYAWLPMFSLIFRG